MARGLLLGRMAAQGRGLPAHLGPKWHLVSQSARLPVQAKNGGSNRRSTSRIRVKMIVGSRYIRVGLPVFEVISNAGTIQDALLSGQFFFQVGIEYPFNNSASGWPARIPVTFSGLNYAAYDSATWDTNNGVIWSDTIDLGVFVPSGAYYGVHCTVEKPAGTWTNALPNSVVATNFIDRWACQAFATTSGIAALGGASDLALTGTSLTKLAATQTGVTGVYTPLIEVLVPGSYKSAVVLGDSLGQAVNEGGTGSLTAGDTMGDADGNCTMHDRGLFGRLGIDTLNLSKGSDANKFLSVATNWPYRRQLLQRANPDFIFPVCVHNDISASITITGYAAGAITKYQVASANSAMWMAENAGTGVTAPSGGVDGGIVNDNGISWYKIPGGFPASANPRGFGQIFAWQASVFDQIRAVCPKAKLIPMLGTPDATGAVPSTGWGDATSRRGMTNAYLRALTARLGIYKVLDPNAYLETGADTSLWLSGMNADATHMNSVGHLAGAQAYSDLGLRL